MAEENPKITEEIEEIIHMTQDIIVKLSLDIPLGEDLSFLQQSQFYFEIFKIIFNSDDFLDDVGEDGSANRIQKLLDFLASDVLFVNLEHINGEEISNGNIAHIKNFLQLIWALINVEEGGEEVYREPANIEMNEVFDTERGKGSGIEQMESEVSKEMIEKVDLDIVEYEDSVKDKGGEKSKRSVKVDKASKKSAKGSTRKAKLHQTTEPDEEPKKPKRKNRTVDLAKKPERKAFRKKKTIEKEDGQEANLFIQPKFSKTKNTKKTTQAPAGSHIKPVVVNHIEKNIYAAGQHRYLKREGGTLKDGTSAVVSSNTLKNLEDYLNPQPEAVNKLKDTMFKHKREYQKCLGDFVAFLRKNSDKAQPKDAELKRSMKKERTIRAFEKKLQGDIQNEEMSNYYRMRDEVARYVKRM